MLRAHLGPTRRADALRSDASALRARFGLSDTRNALHGADSAASAARELAFFFGDDAARLVDASLDDLD